MSGTLRIVPLGGLGEIGKNMSLVEYDGRIVVIDAGVSFPTPEMRGVDLVIPDFQYLRERASAIEGLVVTHGHEDHVGAVPWVIRDLGADAVPAVYGRRLTAAMVRAKFDEHKLRTPVKELEPGQVVELGPFSIEFVHLSHSIPDAGGVIIKTPLGDVFFTGDYRFDQTPVDGKPADMERLVRLGSEGLLLLCGDSTNADRPGVAASESAIGPELLRVFERCQGRIIVTSFASNIHRVQQVADAAAATGRKLALLGRSMVRNVEIGRELGHIQVEDGLIVNPKKIGSLDDERVVIMSTGSQGEPLAALRRMAYQEHKQVRLKEGDTVVFSANPVPGNERAVNETIDHLFQVGCEVITAKDAPIHTSGHGHREELKLMLNVTRPRYLMPVHGDHQRIKLHAELGRELGIPAERIFRTENGGPLEIDRDGARLAEPVQAGVFLVDGIELGDETEAALRDRRSISSDGVLFVVATVSEQHGDTLTDPEVIVRGVPLGEHAEGFIEELREAVEDVLDKAAEDDVHEIDAIERLLHDRIGRDVYKRLRRRPMIIAAVIEV